MDLLLDHGSTDGARAGGPERRRVLVYADGMSGLGHLRRTLGILHRVAEAGPETSSLVLTGSRVEPLLGLPDRCDTVRLPSRHGRLHELRRGIALATAKALRPHVVLVDCHPLGLCGELEPMLRSLRESGCPVVLGLRDGDGADWDARTRAAVRALYDAVLVYAPAATGPALGDLGLPVVHTGYVNLTTRAIAIAPDDLDPGYLLATTGGGHAGFRLLATLAEAIRRDPPPARIVMVGGPLLAPEAVAQLRALIGGLPVQLFVTRTDMDRVLAGARAVVSTAGYNTVAETLRAGLPALLIPPRGAGEAEQLARARRLAAAGIQDVLEPDRLDATALRSALDRLLARPRPVPDLAEHRGAERTAELLAGLAPAIAERPARAAHA